MIDNVGHDITFKMFNARTNIVINRSIAYPEGASKVPKLHTDILDSLTMPSIVKHTSEKYDEMAVTLRSTTTEDSASCHRAND